MCLRQMYELMHRAFPREDIGRLLSTPVGRGFDSVDLITDLDLYWGTIAGYSSWGLRILEWTVPKLIEVRKELERGFYEHHPHYRPLESLVSRDQTPDLHAQQELCEQIRVALLDVIGRALEQIGRGRPVTTEGRVTYLCALNLRLRERYRALLAEAGYQVSVLEPSEEPCTLPPTPVPILLDTNDDAALLTQVVYRTYMAWGTGTRPRIVGGLSLAVIQSNPSMLAWEIGGQPALVTLMPTDLPAAAECLLTLLAHIADPAYLITQGQGL